MRIQQSIQKKLLAVPIYAQPDREPKALLRIYAGQSLRYELYIPTGNISQKEPDYYAALPLDMIEEAEIEIEAEVEESYLRLFHQMDEELLSDNLSEKESSVHYHAPYGWINDPNGMVYHQGVYHLYYQHNPFNTEWENMSWGHCISTDLVHFTYVSDVLFPDEYGTMYSGCAIVNERGLLGLAKDAILYFYTAAGGLSPMNQDQPFTQRLAYSLDGGMTLIKHESFCIPHMEEGNRDPKVFWHEQSGAYVMSLFLSKNRFMLLRSSDLLTWEEASVMDYPPMWECPDLFLLRAKDGEEKWAFMSADGYYFIGEFDGYRFSAQTEMLKLYEDEYPYAAQSFSGMGERVVSIAWLRTADKGKKYAGFMSFPREFSLGKDEQGYYIFQSFVQEGKDIVTEEGEYAVVSSEFLTERIRKDGRGYSVTVLQ